MPHRATVVLTAALALASCAEPPDKELHEAQGAIDAAEAAGAGEYAPAELDQARTALTDARGAARQRDYRLALAHALDASQAAQEAARKAADEQARARSEAERALADLTVAVARTEEGLNALRGTRGAAATLARGEAALSASRLALQDAGTALADRQYRAARDQLTRALEQISAVSRELDTRPASRRRR